MHEHTMTFKNAPRCLNCLYWANSEGNDAAPCMCHPPTIVDDEGFGIFPKTWYHHGCSEFRENPRNMADYMSPNNDSWRKVNAEDHVKASCSLTDTLLTFDY